MEIIATSAPVVQPEQLVVLEAFQILCVQVGYAPEAYAGRHPCQMMRYVSSKPIVLALPAATLPLWLKDRRFAAPVDLLNLCLWMEVIATSALVVQPEQLVVLEAFQILCAQVVCVRMGFVSRYGLRVDLSIDIFFI